MPTTTCESDSNCDTENCEYCLSSGKCAKYNDDYCKWNECGHGDGDCDHLSDGSDECSSDTSCVNNNFLFLHPLLKNCKGADTALADEKADACIGNEI